MDPERRNRVAALLATTDHIPAALGRELLADHDSSEADLLEYRAAWLAAKDEVAQLDAEVKMLQDDANRLAAWIVKNPRPGPEMTAVLDAHDRTLPF